MPNFIKIRPVGAELFDADRWTDRQTNVTKLIVVFRSFSNAPKNGFSGHMNNNYVLVQHDS